MAEEDFSPSKGLKEVCQDQELPIKYQSLYMLNPLYPLRLVKIPRQYRCLSKFPQTQELTSSALHPQFSKLRTPRKSKSNFFLKLLKNLGFS